jgi:hypothetical protein
MAIYFEIRNNVILVWLGFNFVHCKKEEFFHPSYITFLTRLDQGNQKPYIAGENTLLGQNF